MLSRDISGTLMSRLRPDVRVGMRRVDARAESRPPDT